MHRWPCLLLAGIIALFQFTNGYCSSLIHKNYIVRYDRGWDILCEPYMVQQNDSILKIFRQKGEISHKDYQSFLDIFKRLNPQIRNVDLIRPGQAISIPLRKMEHGTLPGQESGVITITFVALNDVTEAIKRHSSQYTVKKGDIVSVLIARKFGRYGSKPYREGVQLFKATNSDVTNLELIYIGQKLNIPNATIREEPWYESMFDGQGNLREKVPQEPIPALAEAKPAPEAHTAQALQPKSETLIGNLRTSAECVGGQFKSNGTYYLPFQGTRDFELDLSRHPMLEFSAGPKLIFTTENTIMDLDKDELQTNWPEMMPVTLGLEASTEQYIAAIFDALNDGGEHAEKLIISKFGVQITVRAKYVRKKVNGRQFCITPIASADQQTPAHIKRYLEQNGIVIKEVIPGEPATCSNDLDVKNNKTKKIVLITPQSQKDFVDTLAKRLGFSYIPDTPITFLYAGMAVEAYGNLLSTDAHREILVDFSDLYGDAIASIEKTGLNVLQIRPKDSYLLIAQKLLTALSIKYDQRPTFLAAKRSAEYNTAITIDGVSFINGKNRRVLLTGAGLHTSLVEMLRSRAIDIVSW